MNAEKQWLTQILKNNNLAVPPGQKELFEKFVQDPQNKAAINSILQQQQLIMDKWKREEKATAIIQQPVRVLNATVGKPYETLFHFIKLGWTDIAEHQFEGLDKAGLRFDEQTGQITGAPTQSGDHQIAFRFKLAGQPAGEPFYEKLITLIINPDPKSLWKNLDSDKNDPYWKEDDVTLLAPLGNRQLLVSSKRGRSHANVGSFREDDFAFANLENGWSIVVVADGAGSAKVSRKGSALACQNIVNHFALKETAASMLEFDALLKDYQTDSSDETQKKLNRFVYNQLGKPAFGVHKSLQAFAEDNGLALKDLSTTLVFCLFKKYGKGYAFLSFGVGDCPMAVVNPDRSKVIPLNWIDVGEFSGGTRFITMPEIFQNEKFATRFGFKFIEDFSFLVLMSDGIYDPKFSVESALLDIKKWTAFFDDLEGANEDGVKVEWNSNNPQLVQQLSKWMDFWSPGNHDDRTLAIVF